MEYHLPRLHIQLFRESRFRQFMLGDVFEIIDQAASSSEYEAIDPKELITALRFWTPNMTEERDDKGRIVVRGMYNHGLYDGLELAIALIKKRAVGQKLY